MISTRLDERRKAKERMDCTQSHRSYVMSQRQYRYK